MKKRKQTLRYYEVRCKAWGMRDYVWAKNQKDAITKLEKRFGNGQKINHKGTVFTVLDTF